MTNNSFVTLLGEGQITRKKSDKDLKIFLKIFEILKIFLEIFKIFEIFFEILRFF